MKVKIDYDYENRVYQYVPYDHIEPAIKPRYELTKNINKLGKDFFLFRDKEITFFTHTIFDNKKDNESEIFSSIYLNTYNDIINKKIPGLEESCFVFYDDDTKRFLKPSDERILKEKVPFKVERDFFNNYKEVFPLHDSNKQLTINKERIRHVKQLSFVNKADISKYNFIPGNNYSNLIQLMDINIRCQANLQPYKPSQFLNKKIIDELVTYIRKNPDKLWEAWTYKSKKIENERKINKHNYKEKNYNKNNKFSNIIQEAKKLWHTKR